MIPVMSARFTGSPLLPVALRHGITSGRGCGFILDVGAQRPFGNDVLLSVATRKIRSRLPGDRVGNHGALLPFRAEPRRIQMKRPPEVLRGAVTASRERLWAIGSQSERTLMLGTILLASVISAATAYALSQWYAVDVFSTLLVVPGDCWLDWGMNIGRHCFSDYAMVAAAGIQPNPADYLISLPADYQPTAVAAWAPARIPYAIFGLPSHWLGAPRLGLICYLVALTMAVISPAIWAARGARGLERVVIFVTLGAAAIPAWGVIDRGNSTGFVVPIALAYFVALSRQRWGLATITVILAVLVKPQFVVLGVVLLAARQWRGGGIGITGVVVSNIAAFLLWPRGFPGTIAQSIHGIIKFNSSFGGLRDPRNVSFGKALLLIPDSIKNYQSGKIPEGFLTGPRTQIGFAVLVIVVVAVLALGRRIPPVMVGIVLLATATFSPADVAFYYLVFVLPIAALVARDPNGPPGAGIFDQLAAHGDRRRAVGVCVSLAVALSIVNVAVPGQPFYVPLYGQLGAKGVVGTTPLVFTTVTWAPFLWLVTCVVIIVSYARKPARPHDSHNGPTRESDQDTAASTTSCLPNPVEESSPRGPGPICQNYTP
ncbi:glycosyltransferase 87 family protein [Mycobacterium tuberculosis]|uniref:glycosyltransferase 87 family protein n=1 Tax=Mycobacterium tuberculosis TaxID=1773 RepID=UPI00070F11AA|nr:glycosyltransferase 87 family protein [Mycobacterium tuberculosis]